MVERRVKNKPKETFIRKLSELSQGDSHVAGSKAANLGELVKAGFPVPEGFVLTTDAFQKFIAVNNINLDSTQEMVTAAGIPEDIADALLAAVASLGDVPLAVRSSGVAEDLAGASFAGQYETVLDVQGNDALLTAVKRCWSSAFSDRVVAYRKAQGIHATAGMAVLVQCMVPAEAAGVVFTADPVTGERDVSVVSAVKGSGERLVSGELSPDEWLVRGDVATCRSSPEGILDAHRACAVAELARRVESCYGYPQDIEWAYTGEQLYLLQARPITVLPDESLEPRPVQVTPPPGFWMRDNHIPEPVLPMYRSIYYDAFNAGAKQACSEFGLLIDTIEWRAIGGWEYMRQVPLGGDKEGPMPPVWLLPILARLHPVMRSRMKTCIEAVRSDRAGNIIRLWYNQWKPAQIERITELRDVDRRSLTDSALDEHIMSLVSFYKQSIGYHIRLISIGQPLARLAFTCRDILGWGDAQTLELLSGLSEKSSEPSRRLTDLAQMAAEKPAVRTFLEEEDHAEADKLSEIDPEFAIAFDAYQHEFGCRALHYTFHSPTLAELPSLTLNLIRNQLVGRFKPSEVRAALDKKRAIALDRAHMALKGHSMKELERFEQALKGAEFAYPVREDNVFYNVNAPFGLVRYGLLELGNRLAERNQINARDDVFFLSLDEAMKVLHGGENMREMVAQSKTERDHAAAHVGPTTYGEDPGPPPSLAGFPAEVRFATDAVVWYMEHVFAGSSFSSGQIIQADKLRGIAASPGEYTGPVRVIMSEFEFDKIRTGDVLVCPVTSPVWSMLFPSVGALITDTGGSLSHPAIIAREYGVPAVVATRNATSLLRDDQTVRVDGSRGIVDLNL
jgi:pyruvate,water dikinase